MIVGRFDVFRTDSLWQANLSLKIAVNNLAMDDIPRFLFIVMLARAPYGYNIPHDRNFNLCRVDSGQIQPDHIFVAVEKRFGGRQTRDERGLPSATKRAIEDVVDFAAKVLEQSKMHPRL